MKTLKIYFNLVAGSLAVAAVLCLPTNTRGATIGLTVDPSQSSLTLASTIASPPNGLGPTPFAPQFGGSMVNAWGGNIVVNDLGGGNVSFSGGSSIQALLNPASTGLTFHPNGGDPNSVNPGTLPWSGVDNYGGVALPFGVPWYSAFRDLTLDISAGTGSLAGDPAAGMTLGFTGASKSDGSGPGFALGFSYPVGLWAISSGVNGSAGNVTWDGTTLKIPVVLQTQSFNNGLLINAETWTGQIVAVVGAIPEPSTLALAGLGLVAFAASKLRRS
jgi:hypothetical protein